MPVIATSAMAENHIKTTALRCSCKQNIGMSRRNHHKHDPAPLSLTTASRYISDKKKAVRKNQENDGQMGSLCLDKPMLVQRGINGR